MSRFIDINACLFQPPGWNPAAHEVKLNPNEQLAFSVGETQSTEVAVAQKLCLSRPKKARPATRHATEGSEDDRTSSSSALQKQSSLHSHSDSLVHVEDSRKAELLTAMSSLLARPKPASQAIPYLVISKQPRLEEEFTLIYFHANSEDMFTSLRMGRILSEFYRAKVIIPEYRGYSLLKSKASDLELIKTDMQVFVKELHRSGVIALEKTVLFVALDSPREGVSDRTWPATWPRS